MKQRRVQIGLVLVFLLIFSGAIAGCFQETDRSPVTPEEHSQLQAENEAPAAESGQLQIQVGQLQEEDGPLVAENAQLRKNLEILGGSQAVQLQKRCNAAFGEADRKEWAAGKLANSWVSGVHEGTLQKIADCAAQAFPQFAIEVIGEVRNLEVELTTAENQIIQITQDRDKYRTWQERLVVLLEGRDAYIREFRSGNIEPESQRPLE